MQLGHEGRPEYTHWQQSIGAPGAAPGREQRLQLRPPGWTTSSWSARTPREPMPNSARRRNPRVPSYLPKFAVPRGTTVIGRSGAQPLPPVRSRQLQSARARLGSSGRALGTPRHSTPRAAMAFEGPPGHVGKIKGNAQLARARPKGARAVQKMGLKLKAAFQRGEFSSAAQDQQRAMDAYTVAKVAAEQVEKQRRELERKRKEVEAVLQRLRDAFRTIDKDHNGTVEPAEVLALVKQGGHKVDEESFWNNFNKVDKDHNGLIDENEFLALLTEDVRAPPTLSLCPTVSAVARHATRAVSILLS